ncbi:MAG: Zn-dependent protease [Bacteroidetes bacterium B1(2017)]|nr:MAG: Zn-dependent protease [Bacteroidetes bacterium B1(2017)]
MKKLFVFISLLSLLSLFIWLSLLKTQNLTSNIGSNQAKSIYLQAFTNVPTKDILRLKNQLQFALKLDSSHIKIVAPISLPAWALNQTKTRYRADSLLKLLNKLCPSDGVILGICYSDISSTKGIHKDWGIMGLGYCPGKACIISNYRLKGANKLEKLGKLALHEYGHTQGLKHCSTITCLMRDAEGKDHLNEMTGFCESCLKIITKTY